MQSGPEQLRDWMARRNFNQSETAAYMGVDYTYVSQLVNGVRTPGLTNALKIERHTGIPVEAWEANEIGETESPVRATARNSRQGKA